MNTYATRTREFTTFHEPDTLLTAKSEDYQVSKLDLKLLISRGRKEKDSLTTGYLLHTLGDLEAQVGNTETAHSLHKEAIELDSHTPQSYLIYATGLFRAFNRADLAIKQIRELRLLILSGKWEPTINEPSRHWYMNELNALSEEIRVQRRQG